MERSNASALSSAGADDIRAEIADRLHQEVCQILTATSYLAAILKKDLQARGAGEVSQAEEICAGLREASRATRKLLVELRTPSD